MKKLKSSARTLYATFKHLPIFIILGLIFSFTLTYFFSSTPQVLAEFTNSYKITKAFLVLISLFPTLQITAFLFSFSISFAKMDAENILSRNEAMLSYLKTLIVILMIVFFINICVFEFLNPMLKRSIKNIEAKSDIYTANIYKATELKDINDLHATKMAINFIQHALNISPNSINARHILDELTIKQKKLLVETPNKPQKNFEPLDLNVNALLNLANTSLTKLDFFSAHYFASQALKMTTKDSTYYFDAKKILEEAWDAIENGDNTLDKKNRELYHKKLLAYSAFKDGLYLKAYNLFYDIQKNLEKQDAYIKDIQVEYFLHEVKNQLGNYVFYYEDLENAPAFKSLENFTFSISDGNHKLYEISLDGVAYQPAKHNSYRNYPEVYFENINVTKYNYVNQISWKLQADFARLVPSLSAEKNNSTLQLTMISTDRSRQDIFPKIILGNISEKDLLSQNLPISLETFLLALEKLNPLNYMDLVTLFKLSENAQTFRYNKFDFLQELAFRISFPLMLFILGIYIASIAWNFRFTSNTKFWYIFTLPLIFILASVILEISVFTLSTLLNFYLKTFGASTFLFLFLTFFIFMIFASFHFYYQAKN